VDAVADGGHGSSPNRIRTITSITLAVLGGILVLVGTILLYTREEIIDQEAFADKAGEALQDDAVREVVATELVVGLIEQGSPDLIAGRPLLESVIGTVLDTSPFRQVFREAARETNRLLFVRDKSSVAFNLKDALDVIRFALQSASPQLADDLPRSLDAALLKLKERDFARSTLDAADSVRTLGIVAPILALLALIASVVAATDRRTGVLRAALAVAAAGVALAISYLILHERILAGVVGADELTDEEMRDAVGGILDAFLGGLFGWALLLAFAGLVIAGAAAVADPVKGDPTVRLRARVTRRPATTWGLALRGVLVIAAGLFVALEPDLALRLIALLIGAWLVYFGSTELLSLLQPAGVGDTEDQERMRRRTFARTGIAGALAAAAVITAVIVITSGDEGTRAEALPREGCNGSKELCDLRLGDVVFAGTHNSFSAADSPGWFIANQRRTIERQLADGIRLFLIDTHWGIEDAQGRVRTDFESEGRERNKVVKALPPETLAAAERLAGSVGIRAQEGGEPAVWLCHTVCELGATPFSDALEDFRAFLDANPGEVVILFIEPYVAPAEVEKAFAAAGLDQYVNELDRNAPLPTLGEIVRSGRRLIVFTEQDATPSVPWYLDGFSFIQDTPLGAKTVDQLSCDLNRGDKDSPMLMLNHWADVFPPQRAANRPFHEQREIVKRAHQCERERGLPVSLIATDHYDDGEFIAAIDKLNEERIAAHGGSDG
jgi:hypothetical protein